MSASLRGRRGPDHHLTDDLLTSDTGIAIWHINELQRQMRNGSLIFDPPARRELKRTLRELVGERAEANWDAEGAAPVEASTLAHARRFVDALPMGLPEPDLGVHPDGEISFSWIGSKGHRLSIAVGPTGRITYAYRKLPSKMNGTEWLGDRIPRALINYIATFATHP
ncbi:MAG: hypothetical protein R2810_08020 [Flavobacteriales bacterium]